CDGRVPSCRACIVSNSECKYLARGAGLRSRFRELESDYNSMRRAAGCTDKIHHEACSSADNEPMRRWLEDLRRRSQRTVVAAVSAKISPPVLPVSLWTGVSGDDVFLTRLLTLFWTWAPTLGGIVNRDHFLAGLCAANGSMAVEDESGCSRLLVNAILALSAACLDETDMGMNTLCSRFADEAMGQVKSNQDSLITRLRGVAILTVYESAFRPGSETATWLLGTFYELRDAYRQSEMTRDMATSFDMLAFQLYLVSLSSSTPVRFAMLDGPNVIEAITPCDALWSPYAVSDQPRLSYCKEQMRAERGLVQLAMELSPVMDSDRTSAVPDYAGAKALYGRLLAWHESLMLEFQGQCSLIPAWLFLSLTYHVVGIKLLEPFRGLSFLDFDGGMPASALIRYHSESIVSALSHFKTAYDKCHDFWLLHACHAAVSSLLVLNYGRGGHGSSHTEALTVGCNLLCDLGTTMPLARNMCRDLLVAYGTLPIPSIVRRYLNRGRALSMVGHISNVAIVRGGEDSAAGERWDVTFGDTIHRIV
ncbi:hypothetical protein CP532_0996, partial [Ophiocordyceps camponoti-leonardi (nom. inval.)]